MPERQQLLDAGQLEVLKIVRVVHETLCVGFVVADANFYFVVWQHANVNLSRLHNFLSQLGIVAASTRGSNAAARNALHETAPVFKTRAKSYSDGLGDPGRRRPALLRSFNRQRTQK